MKAIIDFFELYCGISFVFIFGFVFGAVFRSGKEKGYVRVGHEWITVEEYLEKYNKKAKPCDGAIRCPQADDVTCEECGYPAKYMTMDEKESQRTGV